MSKGQSRPEDILAIAGQWQDQGSAVAIATVVQTWGSAPQPAGSKLVINADGRFEGSVSGGCVEGAVVFEAQSVIENGKSKLLSFGVSNDDARSLGLVCGGSIRVYVEPLARH